MLTMVRVGNSTPEPPTGYKNRSTLCSSDKPTVSNSMGGGASSNDDNHHNQEGTTSTDANSTSSNAATGPKFGQSELLQRENFKRLRRQQENGTTDYDTGKGETMADRQLAANNVMARKSINPHKTSAIQAEVIRDLQLAAKRGETLQRGVRETIEEKLRLAAEKDSVSVEAVASSKKSVSANDDALIMTEKPASPMTNGAVCDSGDTEKDIWLDDTLCGDVSGSSEVDHVELEEVVQGNVGNDTKQRPKSQKGESDVEVVMSQSTEGTSSEDCVGDSILAAASAKDSDIQDINSGESDNQEMTLRMENFDDNDCSEMAASSSLMPNSDQDCEDASVAESDLNVTLDDDEDLHLANDDELPTSQTGDAVDASEVDGDASKDDVDAVASVADGVDEAEKNRNHKASEPMDADERDLLADNDAKPEASVSSALDQDVPMEDGELRITVESVESCSEAMDTLPDEQKNGCDYEELMDAENEAGAEAVSAGEAAVKATATNEDSDVAVSTSEDANITGLATIESTSRDIAETVSTNEDAATDALQFEANESSADSEMTPCDSTADVPDPDESNYLDQSIEIHDVSNDDDDDITVKDENESTAAEVTAESEDDPDKVIADLVDSLVDKASTVSLPNRAAKVISPAIASTSTDETIDSLDTELSLLAQMLTEKDISGEIEVGADGDVGGTTLKRKRTSLPVEVGPNGEPLPVLNDDNAAKKQKGNEVTSNVIGAPSQSNTNKKEEVYEMTKTELEVLLISKVTEYFSDKNKSEIGALRQRCEQLEKSAENWRRKAGLYQKRMIEDQIVYQRALQKRPAVAQRPPMRSVGLQVEFTRYVPVGVPRTMTRPTPAVPNQQTTPPVGQVSTVSPRQGLASPATSTSLSATVGTVGSLYSSIGPRNAQNTQNAQIVNMKRAMPQGPLTTGLLRNMPAGPATMPARMNGASLLQNRLSGVTCNTVSGMTVTRTTGAATYLRTGQDTSKINAAANASPVPMRLVPNQAGSLPVRSVAGVQQQQQTRPLTVTPINIPQQQQQQTQRVIMTSSAGAVIDLTADEDTPQQLNRIHRAVNAAQTTLVASSTAVGTIPSILNAGGMSSGGHIVTLGTGVGNNTVRCTTAVRPAGSTLGSTGPVRLAYLMSSVGGNPVVSMVRPGSQPVFVSSGDINRGTQPMRQRMPTFVLQSGATLVPIQPGQTLAQGRSTAMFNVPRSMGTATSGGSYVAGGTTPMIRVTRPPILTSSPNAMVARPAAPAMPTLNRMGTVIARTVVPPQPLPAAVVKVSSSHPAPLPSPPNYNDTAAGKKALPPKPALKISKVTNGIVLSWNMQVNLIHADVASYQLFAYQEGTAAPSTSLWKKVGDVKALPLPMACTLTQFVEGHKYYFAVRAVDIYNRLGPFSDAGSIALVKTVK